ncbi:MAG: sigma 54-interacting transcriptional regulator [Archangium sp.]|nr:sigma 54-interacting transcriptional regulator [Archangium sp.]MDP3151663.1 sigma 54-interacting transcriptional regulator [Archangium sp.]MDP3573181.1 sigma 54-interacting transcriptional regulator [Archangium sp.]
MHSTLTEGFSGAPRGAKTSAFLYRVLDADRPAAPSARFSLEAVDEVNFGRSDDRSASRVEEAGKRTLKLGVADRWMSGQHARLSRVMRAWVLEDTKSKNGVRRNGEQVQRAELADGDVIELGRTFFVFRLDQPCVPDVESETLRPAAPGLATLSPSLSVQFDELVKLAKSSVNIALCGPSGSGKEVVANALHALSARPGPFVAVNCGALPDELVESELFGHRKGAFSGALEDRPGLLRTAHGGTLLLDEVGDLPLDAQPVLLRVLQERAVMPVGGSKPLPVDLRVISATHRTLERLCEQGLFRDDLRARLTGYRLELPSLVSRREDLGLLIGALLQRLAPQRVFSVQLGIAAARAIFAYDWPLNVRELEKALETSLVLSGSGVIELSHLPPELREPAMRRKEPAAEVEGARKAELVALLSQHAGNVSAVARAMGKARMQIQRWMDRYGLDPRSFRT